MRNVVFGIFGIPGELEVGNISSNKKEMNHSARKHIPLIKSISVFVFLGYYLLASSISEDPNFRSLSPLPVARIMMA